MQRTEFWQVAVVLAVVWSMASCKHHEESAPADRLVRLTELSSAQREMIWADTITPPANPFAPAADKDMVTVAGRLGLHMYPSKTNRESYCTITTRNDQIYFLATKSGYGVNGDVVLWRFNAKMFRPDTNGTGDTICVGDTIVVTGYPYAIKDSEYFLLDTYFVQSNE